MNDINKSNFLIKKILNYCYDYEKYPNLRINIDGNNISFKYFFFENDQFKNKQLSSISLVCWNWFQLNSKLFYKIGNITTEEKKVKNNSLVFYSPYSPFIEKNDETNSYNPSRINLLLFQNKEEEKENNNFFSIQFSKYKLLNFNNVLCINSYGYSLKTILKNFKNIKQIKFELSRNKEQMGKQLNEIKTILKKGKNGDLSLTLHFINTNERISHSTYSIIKDFNYCDYLIFEKSNLDKKEMQKQLDFIELMNPIQLHFRSSGIHALESFEPHHYFTKEFFKGCNRMKTFIFDGDFMDFQFLNMAIESPSEIETIKARLLFHDLHYHLKDPKFVNKTQYDSIFISEMMFSDQPQPIPFKAFSCCDYKSRVPYDHSFINYYNEFNQLCHNIKNSKSLKHLNLMNLCPKSISLCEKSKINNSTITTSTDNFNNSIIYSNFFNSLEFNCSLTKLVISNWNFENETSDFIGSISNNKSITNLSLTDGTLRGDMDLPQVSKLLSSSSTNSICKLNISFNNFKDINKLFDIINDYQPNMNRLLNLKINGILQDSPFSFFDCNPEIEEIQLKVFNSNIKNRNIVISKYKSSSLKDIFRDFKIKEFF
ncbi:hypothetical protein ACTA71_003012 [Dictyostelium dimigraforme]